MGSVGCACAHVIMIIEEVMTLRGNDGAQDELEGEGCLEMIQIPRMKFSKRFS